MDTKGGRTDKQGKKESDDLVPLSRVGTPLMGGKLKWVEKGWRDQTKKTEGWKIEINPFAKKTGSGVAT